MPIEASDFRDHNDEFAPPWARFPDYERYTIGWRMGIGESYLGWWWSFVNEEIGAREEDRLAYLQRHPAAPFTWWKTAWNTWRPSTAASGEQKHVQMAELLDAKLIAEDVAFRTWLRRDDRRLPWENHALPAEAARYSTRELWFWSRRWRAPGGALSLEKLPVLWRPGTALELSQGLHSLAMMLVADTLVGPWALGMQPADAEDSYELDMNFVDAFRLWLDSAFDDGPHLKRVMRALGLPNGAWTDWVEQQALLDGF